MPCTTLLVGKKASYNGSALMARNEDCGHGSYNPKKFTVVKSEDQPRHYVSVISKVEIDLPDNPLTYTAMPNAIDDEGIWAAAGVNHANVAMTGTETITTNSRVLGADPMVKGGIGEEDIVTITLPYIHSAREGVMRLAELLETYGTYERNGIAFQDENEIWWMETIGGHHYIAVRVPDDCYVLIANQQGIRWFDFKDAYGEKKNHICSEDMAEFIENNHLGMSVDDGDIKENTHFDIRSALGSATDHDRYYNTPRVWYALKYFNPHTEGYGPMDLDLPFFVKPEKKITVEDVKEVLSSCFEGTEYDPYLVKGDLSNRAKFRPIGINRNNFVSITEIRPDIDEKYRSIEWIAMASNRFNTMVPVYTNITKAPAYLENVTEDCKTDNLYWVSRLLGALTDMSMDISRPVIERYCLKTVAEARRIIAETDKDALNQDNINEYLEKANDTIVKMVADESQKALNRIIENASNRMRNAYSRSDS